MGAWEFRVARQLKASDAYEQYRKSFYGEIALALGTALLLLGWFLPIIILAVGLIWWIAKEAIVSYGLPAGLALTVPYAGAILWLAGIIVWSGSLK